MTNTPKKILFVVTPGIIGAFLLWIGVESFYQGDLRSEWVPQITYGILYPLAVWVSTYGSWKETSGSGSNDTTTLDRLAASVYASWSISGVIFLLLGYWSLIVVTSTVLGALAAGSIISLQRK